MLACLRCLAREKRGGLAACRLGTCVIGGGGLVAWARQIWSSARRTRGLASCGRATIVACIRITSHELLRDGVRAAAAFLLRRPHRAGFLSGSFSAAFGLLKAEKRAKGAPGAAPGGGWGTDWAPGEPGSPPGPQPGAGGCQRQRTRPKGASAEHTRARRELKTSVRQCMAFRCAYVKFLAPERCGA